MDKNDIIFFLALAIIVIILIIGVICSDADGFTGIRIFPMPIGGKITPIIL